MTFKHSKKWYFWASVVAKLLGCLFAVLPALVATVAQFPVMVTKNTDSTVSLFFLFAALLSVVAVVYVLGKAIKNNTYITVIISLFLVTLVLFGGYAMEKQTILGLAIVALSATGGNMLAAVCFSVHRLWYDLYKNCGEIYGEVNTK